MKRFSAVAIGLPLLAACSGGGGASAIAPQVSSSVSVPLAQRREWQNDASNGTPPRVLASPGASDLLYIGNSGNNSITVYRHDASGNTPPVYTLAGANTQINSPGQLSEDAQGNLYVANGTTSNGSVAASVLVFAHGASGNVAPIRKLAGSLTGLHSIGGLTVDQTTGKIFVIDDAGYDPSLGLQVSVSLVRFEPNATGNIAPYARSTPDQLLPAYQIANDSTGDNIISAHQCEPGNCNRAGVDTYAKQFANNTDPANPYDITDLDVAGIADDPTTKSYLVTTGGGIYRLAESTQGHGPQSGSGPIAPKWTPNPISIITSDTCGSQLAVAPGPTPYTYVTHSTQSECPVDAVYVYANNAAGAAKPVRTLSGASTKLNKPYGIYEGL